MGLKCIDVDLSKVVPIHPKVVMDTMADIMKLLINAIPAILQTEPSKAAIVIEDANTIIKWGKMYLDKCKCEEHLYCEFVHVSNSLFASVIQRVQAATGIVPTNTTNLIHPCNDV
jgi:hypothetical protein